ncbi:MAG: response regulator, partial [Syntrophobacteraceae bacterium]
RILIVDDNATNREILTMRLSSWGMRPEEVEDGQAALEALSRGLEDGDPFRLAVIDMQMSSMDGETLGKAIQADKRLSGTRMVMLTSLGTRGDARRFAETGFAAYLTKPVRHQELRGVLSLALAEHGGTAFRPIATRHTAREMLNRLAGRKARILLAEDNITNQQVALGILTKLGLQGDVVANGVEALKALEIIPYDLVLMDVQMPEMDGLEATRRIRDRSASRNHKVPVIAMTAHAMRGDREKCLAAGMNDYVSKPVTPHEVAEVLEKWLPRDKVKSANKDAAIHEGVSPSSNIIPYSPLIFDREGMMARLMDDEELALTVAEGFFGDMQNQIASLKSYLEAGDVMGAGSQAHIIKGASANVGGEVLRMVAFEMEQFGDTGDIEGILSRFPELEERFAELKAAMERYFSRGSAGDKD